LTQIPTSYGAAASAAWAVLVVVVAVYLAANAIARVVPRQTDDGMVCWAAQDSWPPFTAEREVCIPVVKVED